MQTHVPGDSRSNDDLQLVKAALRNAMASVAASRVAACVLQHKGWCLAPLQTLENIMIQLKAYSKESEHWPDGGTQSPAAVALKAAIAGLEEPFQTCLEILIESIPSQSTDIDAESVVFLIANLDSMYYVLLDHHLTAPLQTPSVPPPHHYFPAVVDLMRPEADAAVSSLMLRSGAQAAAKFQAAWGLTDGNTFEGDVDPLRKVRQLHSSAVHICDAATCIHTPVLNSTLTASLHCCIQEHAPICSNHYSTVAVCVVTLVQVMWARWQEAAVLLFHRGLGTNGEMDDAAVEEAGFREWVANREKDGAEGDGAAVGVAQGMVAIPEDSVQEPAHGAASAHVAEIGGISEQEFDKAMQIALGVMQCQLMMSQLHLVRVRQHLLTTYHVLLV